MVCVCENMCEVVCVGWCVAYVCVKCVRVCGFGGGVCVYGGCVGWCVYVRVCGMSGVCVCVWSGVCMCE